MKPAAGKADSVLCAVIFLHQSFAIGFALGSRPAPTHAQPQAVFWASQRLMQWSIWIGTGAQIPADPDEFESALELGSPTANIGTHACDFHSAGLNG